MLKKLLVSIILTATIIVSTVLSAYAVDTQLYNKALQYTANERTDIYAIDSCKCDVDEARQAYPGMAEVVDAITANITDDYAKAKAICRWVMTNVYYTTTLEQLDEYKASGLPDWRCGQCMTFAFTTQMMLQIAGLPAKCVVGIANGNEGWQGHAWNEVYIDNRWVYVDTVWGDFDVPASVWSKDHEVSPATITNDKEAWDGTLYIVDTNDNILKEIKNYPLNGLVTSTYGYDINNMYLDIQCTKSFKLNTMQVNARHNKIYIKSYTVVYYTQDDNADKSIEPYMISNVDGRLSASMTVAANTKLNAPRTPVKKGYTFIGWYTDSNPKYAKKWDFNTDRITSNMMLIARFVKGTAYTVTFSTNGGTSISSVIVTGKSKLIKPVNPIKNGYKFVNWYKDAKCTKAWNFATDKVTANTTLYAGWKKI